MRRAYVELVEGEEEYCYDYYKNEFDTVVEELDEGKRWQLSKIYFPGYLKDCAGLALVAKVLSKLRILLNQQLRKKDRQKIISCGTAGWF